MRNREKSNGKQSKANHFKREFGEDQSKNRCNKRSKCTNYLCMACPTGVQPKADGDDDDDDDSDDDGYPHGRHLPF